MGNPFSAERKKAFIEHIKGFTRIIEEVREQANETQNNIGFAKELDRFWYNCIQDGGNVIGALVSCYGQEEVIKGLVGLLFWLYFCRSEHPILNFSI